VVSLLIAVLGWNSVRIAGGEPLTTLHSFSGSDGINPRGALVLSSNTLYGTAMFGGSGDEGTVFKVNTDGSGFTNIYSFTATIGGTNADGANPSAGLLLSGCTLYGTTVGGGIGGSLRGGGMGTIFRINTDGTGFTNLHNFNAYDGMQPAAGLVLSSNTLYGTTRSAAFHSGTLFAINTDGTGFTNLFIFDSWTGINPEAKLTLVGNTLYGTTSGGTSKIFKINTDGSDFKVLYNLSGPLSDLVMSDGVLCGTSQNGNVVFAAKSDGTEFTNLFSFTYDDSFNGYPNGVYPVGGLELSGNILYGTASGGGTGFAGVIFQLNTDGTGFTLLHNFYGPDGVSPEATLVYSGTTLFGTTYFGGDSDNGTVFSLFIPPQLTIVSAGPNIVLSWPTNYTGFTLQSTTNLDPSTAWTTNLPSTVVVNGRNTVTNPISGTKQFFRLGR
jgi:uncharacterized repeat protein (TIGR03803 family)